jgi:flavorubredoxin
MEAVARGVAEAGCLVRAYDVSRTSLSVLLGECWRWRGVILGAPTYDTGIFLPMENLLRDLTHKRLKNRVCGLFGSFSWSGGSVKQMRDMVTALQWDIVEPEVAFKSHAGTEQIEQLESLGRAVAERVLNPQATPESEDTARHTA